MKTIRERINKDEADTQDDAADELMALVGAAEALREDDDGEKVMSVQKALKEIREAMQKDPHFAWGWHCNIAMAAYDEGLEHIAANRAAARFMKLAFQVDTSEIPDVFGDETGDNPGTEAHGHAPSWW